MARQRWGTFSVADHTQRGAFIADVLLYDRLVIPSPPEGAEDSWPKRWDPVHLSTRLMILGDLAERVPWDAHKHAIFQDRAAVATAIDDDIKYGMTRQILAESSDDAYPDGELLFHLDASAQGGLPEEGYGYLPDEVLRAFAVEAGIDLRTSMARFSEPEGRWLVTDQVTHRTYSIKPEAGRLAVRRCDEVLALAAYPTPGGFKRDFETAMHQGRQERLGNLIRHRFLEPDTSDLNDVNMTTTLERAAALAQTSRFRESRREFYRWQDALIAEGQSNEQIVKRMEEALAECDGQVRDRFAATRQVLAFTAFNAALEIGSSPDNPVSWAKGLSPVVQVLTMDAWKLRRADEEVSTDSPVAMFRSARALRAWRDSRSS